MYGYKQTADLHSVLLPPHPPPAKTLCYVYSLQMLIWFSGHNPYYYTPSYIEIIYSIIDYNSNIYLLQYTHLVLLLAKFFQSPLLLVENFCLGGWRDF